MADLGRAFRKLLPGVGNGAFRTATPFTDKVPTSRPVSQPSAEPGHAEAVFEAGTPTVPSWVEVGDLSLAGWEIGAGLGEFNYLGATGSVAFDMDMVFTFPAGSSGNGWWTITNYTTSDQIFGTVTPSAPGDVLFHCDGTIAFTTGDVLSLGLGGSFSHLPTAVVGIFP